MTPSALPHRCGAHHWYHFTVARAVLGETSYRSTKNALLWAKKCSFKAVFQNFLRDSSPVFWKASSVLSLHFIFELSSSVPGVLIYFFLLPFSWMRSLFCSGCTRSSKTGCRLSAASTKVSSHCMSSFSLRITCTNPERWTIWQKGYVTKTSNHSIVRSLQKWRSIFFKLSTNRLDWISFPWIFSAGEITVSSIDHHYISRNIKIIFLRVKKKLVWSVRKLDALGLVYGLINWLVRGV